MNTHSREYDLITLLQCCQKDLLGLLERFDLSASSDPYQKTLTELKAAIEAVSQIYDQLPDESTETQDHQTLTIAFGEELTRAIHEGEILTKDHVLDGVICRRTFATQGAAAYLMALEDYHGFHMAYVLNQEEQEKYAEIINED